MTTNLFVDERFTKALKGNIYKEMIANYSEFYLDYLTKLVEKYNNTFHSCIGKKAIDDDYAASTEDIEFTYKIPKYKVADSGLLRTGLYSANVTL